MQRALMQFFKPENYFAVREALIQAGRADLIGGCEGLIPEDPPKGALEKRRRDAQWAVEGDHYHTVANPAKGDSPVSAGPVRRSQRDADLDGSRKNGGRNELKQ